MKIALYTLTSPLHDKVAVDAASSAFISSIENASGLVFDYRGPDFSDYGSHDLNLIYVRTGGTEGLFKEMLYRIDGHVYILTSGKSNSLAASMEILSFLNQEDRGGEIIHGSIEYIAGRIAMLAKVAEARRKLEGADTAKPLSISVYFVDFAAKETFLDFLDGYNDEMSQAGKEDQVISYTDITGIMMSSVRTIIDSVSYVLIAFVAVSLVVSSIMIGIITYISVMERTKEIGVLRAIGASKHNITQVFNAETFIIGLCSGLIGIGVTLLVLIPGNMVIHHLTDNPDIVAQLPMMNAFVLIGLSVVLTLIGGFIPAKKAAKKDPVIALRSE